MMACDDIVPPYREKLLKRPSQRNIANMFVFTMFILQVITALLSAHTMASQWNELTVSWPYEITFCSCEFMVIILIKVCQLYMTNIAGRVKKERYKWLSMFLALPCLLLMCFGLIACRMVKIRVYNKLVWNMSQLEVFSSPYIIDSGIARNLTVPYVDTYQVISMTNYDLKTYVKNAWDSVQLKYQCCGSTSPPDWLMVRMELPPSCCIDPDYPCLMETAFRTGCSPKITEILFEQLRCLEVAIFILMIFECLIIVFVFVSIMGNRILKVARRVQKCPAIGKEEFFLPVATIDGNGMILAEHLG